MKKSGRIICVFDPVRRHLPKFEPLLQSDLVAEAHSNGHSDWLSVYGERVFTQAKDMRKALGVSERWPEDAGFLRLAAHASGLGCVCRNVSDEPRKPSQWPLEVESEFVQLVVQYVRGRGLTLAEACRRIARDKVNRERFPIKRWQHATERQQVKHYPEAYRSKARRIFANASIDRAFGL